MKSNALAGESSPFLQHGATQPVDWSPWGDAAFARARAQDRPILLDIGAVWCHWCHVMDSESYDDAATAALINELFVPVKVDRDERPDVDARYQRAVQLLTGQGGWPLTAFLTPEGEVFHGGTYFPPVDAQGRPSFSRVLREVARIWREDRPRALQAAHGIGERLTSYAAAEVAAGDPTSELLHHTLEELADSFDFRHGGFGRAPKFPNAGALDLLLDHWLDTGTDWARRVTTETLHAMARGGIYDQIGGGFHRYATDARWLIPHFEKMAYDNGPLLATYARAFAAIDAPLYDEVVEGVLAHYRDISPALVDAGGFPASQDADFGFDNDGDYWTWTDDELRAALGDDDDLVQATRLHFGLDDNAARMHLDRARHVLFRQLDATEIAQRVNADSSTVHGQIEDARRRLKQARDARPRPYVDETLYAGWVALVAAGHLAAARHLNRADAASAAIAALDRLHRDAFDPDLGYTHRVGDRATGELLEDQALVAAALVDAFEVTQQTAFLERARDVVRIMLARFHDPASGGLLDRPRDTAAEARPLEMPLLPIGDSPTPSGNGVAALTLMRLHAITADPTYLAQAETILRAFAGSAARLGSSAATWMKALAWLTLPVTTIVVVGDRYGTARELLDTALRAYRPRTIVRWLDPASMAVESLPVELRAMVTAETPRAYLCAGRTCAAPTPSAEELLDLIHTFRP